MLAAQGSPQSLAGNSLILHNAFLKKALLNMLKTLSLLILSSLALSACIDREQSDRRLALGCAAGAETFIAEGFEVKEIKDQKFRNDPALGEGYREVTLTVVETDGWHEGEETYQCIFAEESGLTGYRASLYQLRFRDEVYGKEGDKILGTLNDWLNLSDAVETKMSLR